MLRVPERPQDACRHLWKRGFSIHGDHRSLKIGNITFYHEFSVEQAAEHAIPSMELSDGICRLLLPPTAFEDFFAFLCRFAEGHWAYRFEVNESLCVSTDIIDPTPEQEALWNSDI